MIKILRLSKFIALLLVTTTMVPSYGIADVKDNNLLFTQVTSSTKKNSSSSKLKTVKSYSIYRSAGDHVNTRCFPKKLKAILAKVKNHYGVQLVVSSGFRSRSYNRRVGGAPKSYHMQCMAADIIAPGISKYKLARFVRKLAGVGGVGTYTCNGAVHVDIGPKRNWHWLCGGRHA